MNRRLEWRAIGASLLLNSAGLALLARGMGLGELRGLAMKEMVGGNGWNAASLTVPASGWPEPTAETDLCPMNDPVDRAAAPRFALPRGELVFASLAGSARDPVLCLRVGRAGRVVEAFVGRSSGSGSTDQWLLDRAWRLRFSPARRGAEPVPSWGRLTAVRERGLMTWCAQGRWI